MKFASCEPSELACILKATRGEGRRCWGTDVLGHACQTVLATTMTQSSTRGCSNRPPLLHFLAGGQRYAPRCCYRARLLSHPVSALQWQRASPSQRGTRLTACVQRDGIGECCSVLAEGVGPAQQKSCLRPSRGQAVCCHPPSPRSLSPTKLIRNPRHGCRMGRSHCLEHLTS